MEDGNPQFTNCTFTGNSAGSSPSRGGAMYVRQITTAATTRITNCTFSENNALEAGGLWNDSNGPFGNVVVANCIFWGNDDLQIKSEYGASFTSVVNSDIEGGVQGGFAGTAVINVDPLFIDVDGADNLLGTLDDNLRVMASAVIDTGGNASVPADLADLDGDLNVAEQTPFDLDGKRRILDEPNTLPIGAIVDMGAYEAQSDCNNNGIPDVCDLPSGCGAMGGPCDIPGCGLSADVNTDNKPDECALWDGSANNNWSIAANWDNNMVPDNMGLFVFHAILDQAEVVPAVDVELDIDVMIGSLNILNGAALTLPDSNNTMLEFDPPG